MKYKIKAIEKEDVLVNVNDVLKNKIFKWIRTKNPIIKKSRTLNDLIKQIAS